MDTIEFSRVGYTSAVDMWSLGVVTAVLLTNDAILPRDSTVLSQIELVQLFQGLEDGTRQNIWETLSLRALGFLRKLLAVDAADRLTASQALWHSWLSKPLSEAAAIKECCEKIVRFWKPRASDEVIECLPQVRRSQQDESCRNTSKSRRTLPDASSSVYFSLERHLRPRKPSHRRSLLEDLNHSGSPFVSTSKEPETSQPRILSIHGSDIFGKSPDIHSEVQAMSDEVVSLIPTSPFTSLSKMNAASSLDVRDAACSSRALESSPGVNESADVTSDLKNTGRKRVRWESEDPEEKSLRDEVAKDGPKWQSARDLGIAVMKRRKEVQQHGGKMEPSHPTLTIRTSSRSV